MKRFILLLFILIYPIVSQATIKNDKAFGTVIVGQTKSSTVRDLWGYGNEGNAQTFKAPTTETYDGVVVYMVRVGMDTSTQNVRVRIGRYGSGSNPDTSASQIRGTAIVKVTDVPLVTGYTTYYPADSFTVSRGFAIWFIFSSPVSVVQDSFYELILDAPSWDDNNKINVFQGNNGYGGADYWQCAWYDGGGGWTRYSLGVDFNFEIIRDKYALVAVRRFPFNKKGAIAICSDVDTSSYAYLDTLHKWLNTSGSAGSWGTGINTKMGLNDIWLAKGANSPKTGIWGDTIPIFFSGLDTLASHIDYGNRIKPWIYNRWSDVLHTFVDCGWGAEYPTCFDSAHARTFMDYMINHPDTLGRLYKAGVWVNHASQLINMWIGGTDVAHVGDVPGSGYYHANYTFASGRFKFLWAGNNLDRPKVTLDYNDWLELGTTGDSMNLRFLPIEHTTYRDSTKIYTIKRVGYSIGDYPDSLRWYYFKTSSDKKLSDSNYINILYTHLGKGGGVTASLRDSIKMLADSAETWKVWFTGTKALLNQQVGSAFMQATVDRPDNSKKRRIKITSMHDWSWGSHIPDPEELYYVTFTALYPESLRVVLASDTTVDLACSTLSMATAPQIEQAATYNGNGNARLPVSEVSMLNRTAGRLTIMEGTTEAPATGGKKVMIKKH